MNRIVECLFVEHDLVLVALAALICLASCHTAFRLIARTGRHSGRKDMWIPAAAVCLGGGVWATHFVAMLAFRTTIPIAFDLPLTLLSALVAILFSGLGLWLSSLGRHWVGGAVIGMSIGTMHFTGIAAMESPMRVAWDQTLLVCALAGGIALSMFASRLRSLSAASKHQASAVAVMVLAICTLHFVSMAAMNVQIDLATEAHNAVAIPRQIFAIALGGITAVFLCGGLMLAHFDSFVEQRTVREDARLRDYVAELERTQLALRLRSHELQVALEEADSLSKSKSHFLATMSHELRTPLNAIIGFSEFVLLEPKGPLGDPAYNQYMKDILHSGRHLLNMINEVLDFSKIMAGRMRLMEEPVAIGVVVDEAARMIHTQAENNDITLQIDVPYGLPDLVGDKQKITQILLNLLTNSVKFTDPGGTIRLGASADATGLALVIADTGIGMDEGQLARAVEAFRQVDSSLSRRHEGTGLGLPLCIKLAELHDGALKIDSTPGVGTTITVQFPATRLQSEFEDIAVLDDTIIGNQPNIAGLGH